MAVAFEAMGALWYYLLGSVLVLAFVCTQYLAGKPKYAIPTKDKKKGLPPLMDCGAVPGIGGLIKFVQGKRRRLVSSAPPFASRASSR